ncbi:MAG: hypothetical protein PUF66_00890 [Clostridium sp.]|nr:hypothetical protein [Clostridium sp.]
MKRIINNKIYDTDKCELLLKYNWDWSFNVIYLFKTNKGTYLMYQDVPLLADNKKFNNLVILSKEKTKKLLIELNEVDLYEKEFGKLEEG